MSFRENLQYLRRRENITQEDLAERLEVSRQTVSKWESGACYPEMEKLLQLCDMFHTDLDTLLRGSVERDQAADTACYDRAMNVFTWQVALSVGALIAAAALTMLLEAGGLPEMVTGAVFLLVLTAAVVVLVAGGIQYSFFREKHPVIEDFYTEEQRDAFRRRFVWCIAGGVGAILFGMVLTVLFFCVFPEREPYESWIMSAFLLIVAGAVTTFIYAGMQHQKYQIDRYNRDNDPAPAVKARQRLISAIHGVLMLLAAAVYVGLGLTRGTWRTDWWLFAVGGILCGVVSALLDPYRDE